MQGTISKDLMKSAVKEVWIRSLTEIQPDILEALNAAKEKETNERGRQYLDILIQNALLATQNRTVICQGYRSAYLFYQNITGRSLRRRSAGGL